MAVAFAIVFAAAHVVTGRSGWTLATSDHFEVYTTAGEKRAREAVDYFEQVASFFERYLNLPSVVTSRVRVIVFDSDREYARYRPSVSATAFYQSAYDRDIIVLKDIDADANPIVVHEYAHLALNRIGARFPPWLGEGLAEFFSTITPSGKRTAIGRVPAGRLATLQRMPLMGARRLTAVTHDSPEYTSATHADVFYAESWALAHLIIVDARYRDGAQRLINLVANGTPTATAMMTVYGKTLEAVEGDLRQYITRESFNYYFVDFAVPDRAVAVRVTSVPSFDGELVLAELLASQLGREAQARAAFVALDTQHPNEPRVLDAWALFERRMNHQEAAEALFVRAAEHGSPMGLAYSAYFRARRMLTDKRPIEALAMLTGVTEVPESLAYEFYQVVANARFARGDLQEAADAAARVVQSARNPTEAAHAASLVQFVGGPPDMTHVVRGRLRYMQCDAPLPVLEVATADGVLRLVIDDRSKVLVAGGVMTTDLACGEQDRALTVGYASANAPSGTQGRLRFLDFRTGGAAAPSR